MYAFLSKVFGGRKKDDRDASSSSQPVLGPGELLGGRFEAVSANVSPSSQLLELDPNVHEAKDKEKERDKDVGFSFFKGKWRPASPDVRPTRKLDILPHLSLNFQEPKAEPATPNLGLLFTTDQILSDAEIGQRRLNPLEALILVQACSRAIVARGLETLGIMHPHWYAASHTIQRRVISHFIYLSNLENGTSIPSLASPTSPLSAFEAEVNDTFSPHDIAAILRWGLRHVQIEGDSFGTNDGWYKTFLESEAVAGYPPKAFSDKLAPLLPTTHLQLLTATLEIFSSLAAHAEVNGTSGSELCKLFGLWLLTAHRVEDKDDWKTFYARWERTGRMLEHLFLSRIRDQSTDQRMPIRLLELIHKYPYNQGLSSPTTDLSLLPHPPFTTRLQDALFVRIEIELPYGKRKPSSKLHPLSLLTDAFSTKVEGEYADLWAKITAASKNGDSSVLTNIFADDTISFLSSVPDEPSGHEVKSPTFGLASSESRHKPSCSVDDADKLTAFVPGHPKSATELSPMSPLSPLNNGIGNDWAQFSASGFLEVNPNIIPLASTLLDNDIEKTTPPEAVTPLSRKSSKSKRSKAASPSSPRKSFDLHRPTSPEAKLEGLEEQKNIIKASQPRIVQIDEAFIDFWSDSLLDPISANWPTFIICEFKSSLVPELTFGIAQESQKQKTIQWLVLEQVYTIRTPPVAPIVVVRPRPSSPISPSPSLKNRFSFWSVSRTASTSSGTSQKGKKKDQELRVGEMGELLEEPKTEGKELAVRLKSPIFRSRKSLDIAPKSTERKSVVKPAEEAKIDEETSAVAAVATGIVVASAAVVITNDLPTAQPTLVEAVTMKAKVDHSTDIPAIEAVSTRIASSETVVPSPEPTVKQDEIPLSTADPDVVSYLEAKVETEPLESEILVEGTAIEAGVIVGEETEGGIEIEPNPATQVVPASVTDAAPITTEAITEVGETVGVLAQPEPIVVPLVSAVAIPEPEIEIEASAQHETSTAEEAPAVFTSEPETSYAIEATPAAVDHSLLAESGSPDDENAVNQPETIMELQSELEPRATEAEHMFTPVEDKTDGKTSDSAPILAAAQQLPDVASQEIFQPQSTAELVTEDVLDNKENHQVEIITSSTKLEGLGTAEIIETKEFVVKEAKHDFAAVPDLPDVNDLEHEVETEATASEPLPTSTELDLPTTIEPELDTDHSDEPTAVAEDSAEIVNATGVIEHQSELEQETLTARSPSAQETGEDDVSSSKDALTADIVAQEVEAETHGTDANDLAAAELPETEQHVMPTTEGDFTEHVTEAAIVAVGLATAEELSSMDKEVPEVDHEATPEARNESVESGTTLNTEPQREDEVDVTVPEAEDTLTLDTHSSVHNDPTPVSLPLEPEIGLIETELVAERQVETTSTTTTNIVPFDVEVQPDPSSSETAPDAPDDIEVQTQVDDTSNIEDEPIPKSDIVEAADAEGLLEGVPAPSAKQSEDTVQLEPEVDFVAPTEEEPLPLEPDTKTELVAEGQVEATFLDPVLPDANDLEHEVETEAIAEPLPTSIEQDLSTTTIEPEQDTAHSDGPAAITEGSTEIANATGVIEHQSELEQATLTALSPAVQETGVDAVSRSKDALTADVVAHEVETEVEAETHGTDAATTTNDLAAAESPETEQPVIPTTEGDSTKHVNEAAIVAVGLATAEELSSMDKEVPEVDHEATPEARNESVESGTTLNIEPQREDEVDVTVPEAEDTLPDIHSNLHNDPTPVSLPLEPEVSHIEMELVAEGHVETTSMAKTNNIPIDVEVQPDPSSSETAPDAQKDIEVQTQVDDTTSDIKDEPIPNSDIVEAGDTEGPLEDVPASSEKQSQDTVQLEPEVDFVAPAEEEPLPLEPEISVTKTELVAERQIEATFSETTTSVPVDAPVPVLPDVNDLEHAVETEATAEPLPTSIEQDFSTSTIEPEPDTAHSDEPAAITEGSPEIANATGVIELQSELEQESLTALSLAVQETGEDVVVHEVESEVETETHGTDAATTTNDLAAEEFPEMEQHVIPTTEGDSTEHVIEAAIVAVGLATAEEFSSMDKEVPEVTNEATPEVRNELVESETTLNIEPQREDEVDVTVPETEDILPDIHSSLRNDPTPVSLPLEPEVSLIETELVAERQVETTSTATTNNVPIDVGVQPDPSLSETDAQKDIEVQTQVDDTSDIKDEPISKSDIVEAADAEGLLEDTPASSAKQSEDTVQLEPEVDFVAPAEEEPSPLEPEISLTKTELVAECQVETTSSETTKTVAIDVEVQPPPNAEKDIEVQTHVDDTSNIKDEAIVKSDIVEAADTEGLLEDVPASSEKQSQDTVQLEPEVDFVAPVEEDPSAIIQVAAEGLLPKIESEDAIFQTSGETIPIPEDATASVANIEDQIVAPVDVRLEHAQRPAVETSYADELAEVILSPDVEESPETLVEPSYKRSDDEMVGSHVDPGVDVPVPETQDSGEAAIVPIMAAVLVESDLGRGAAEDMSVPSQEVPEVPVEPVKVQLEIPETEESDRTAEVEHQIIPAIMIELPAQNEEDRPVTVALQDDTTLSKAVHTETLDTELAPIEDPASAMVVESEPDAFHMDTSVPVVPTPGIDVDFAVTAQAPEVQEDRLDTAVVPEAEPDLPSNEIKTEGSSSIKEGDAVQDSSPSSKNFADIEVQPEAQVPEETSNIVEADSGVAAVNILPEEALPSAAINDTNDHLTSTSTTAVAGEFIGEIPVVTNVISDESAVSATPLNEENHLQQFEASADLQISDAIVIEDAQNVIPSHEPAEGNDISESTVEEGTLTDIYASVDVAIPASVEESIDPNFEHIASGDISKPESELPLNDEDTPPVDNPQDNISITAGELDTGPTHVDEMPLEVVKDEEGVAAEPSVIMVDPASESSTNLDGASETIEYSHPLGSILDAHIDTEPIDINCPQVLNDVSNVADEHERSAMESDPIMSELTAEPAAAVISSIQDGTAPETKVDSIEEVYTVASIADQSSALPTQTEHLESIDPAVLEAAVSEEANPEKSSAHSDINGLGNEQTVGVERIEESLVLPAEVVQEPTVDEVGPEFDVVPATTTDELLTTESPVIDHPIEGPQAEPEAKDNAPDRLEILSQTDIMATDETAPPTRNCEVIEPSESTPVLSEPPVEQPEILEHTGSSVAEFSISAAETGASATNIFTEPFEDPKRSMETPEIEGISETHSQVSLADVQVLPETKDNLVQDLAEPVNSHMEVEESVKTSPTTEPLVAEIASVISEPATVIPVMPTTELEGDSTRHVDEAVIAAVGLATAEEFSSMDKVVPEVTLEATPETENDSMENGATLNVEPQREHEVDVTVPEAEDTLLDIHSSLHNDPTPVPLPLEPEISLIKTELAAEGQVETTSTATTNSVPIDVEVQPDPSLGETAPDAQKDIEVQTHVDDTSNTKDEPIPKSDIVEAADTEGPLEDVPASSTKQSEDTVLLEPEVDDLVAPAEEEPSAITEVAAENLLPKIESEGAISQTPGETTPIPEDVTASVANVEDQIMALVDVRSEHAAVIETSCTDALAEIILPPNVEESPETLTPLVEPSCKSSDDEMVASHVISEVPHLPETQDFGEAAIVPIMAAALVESDLGQGVAEDMSVPSQELPVNPEPEELVTHEEAVHIQDTQNVIPSYEPAAEGNDISESTSEEGVLTDIYASIDAAIPASVEESIDPNIEHISSGDISKPESELPLNDEDTPPVDNPQDNISITAGGLDTGPTHIDEMPLEVVKDEEDVAAVIMVDPASEFSTNLDGASETIEHSYPFGSTLDAHIDAEPIDISCPQVPNDVSNVADEHERSASHLEVVDSVQSDLIMSELTAEPATTIVSSLHDRTAAETKVDNIEGVYTEASTVDQANTLSTQTEDPTMEQLKTDAQIESIDPAVQEDAVSEEANPEKPSAHSDINSLGDEQIVGVERIEESLVLPAEVVQEPRVDEVGPEFDAVPATITDELLTTESPVIDHPIEGPLPEPEAKDNLPDRLENLSQTDIMATDETVPPTRDCEVIEPSESAPVLLELSVEQPEILERTESSITESSMNGNGHSTTTQETIGTHGGLEASSVNLETNEENFQADPKVIEPIYPSCASCSAPASNHLTHDIFSATLEAPSITD